MQTREQPDVSEPTRGAAARQVQILRALRRDLQGDDVDLRLLVLKFQEVPEAAARIITTANSALAGGGRTIRELRHAIAYIGLRRVSECLRASAQLLEQQQNGRRAA